MRRVGFALTLVLLKPIHLLAWSSFAFQEELREGGPWLHDAVLAAIAGCFTGCPALFAIYFCVGLKYRKQVNILSFAVKATRERIGSFVLAFIIGCFAYCFVLMLPGFIIYNLWHTFHGLPVGDKNIHGLYWLYASIFVFSYVTALVGAVKRTGWGHHVQKA
jgi:hypothetical protein